MLLAAITAVTAVAAPTVAVAATKAAARARAASNLCANADSLPTKLTADQAQATTLCLMNAQRTARGLRPLRLQPTLDKVATDFAAQMAAERFFDHVSPGGSTLVSRVKSTSYLSRVTGWSLGENIAWGTGELSTARATVKGWMKSPPHRSNLLSSEFTEVGIGLADGGATAAVNPKRRGTTYVTDFGKRTVRADSAKQR
jgi:uncharacterized protein YkwD